MLAASIYATAVSSIIARAKSAQEKNPFVGVWEPAPNQDMEVFVESLWIDEDGTFAAKMTGGRENQKGTYKIQGGKLLLETEEFKKHNFVFQGVITDDGQLKLTKGTDDDKGIYFKKKQL
jgi:hypothetical protein